MHQPEAHVNRLSPPGLDNDSRARWLAAGGIVGAVLASSCCVLPLALVLLGVSGAWIGNLTALEPFTPLFAVITLSLTSAGLWHAYRAPSACTEGACTDPHHMSLTRVALWLGVALVLVALSTRWWAPVFY